MYSFGMIPQIVTPIFWTTRKLIELWNRKWIMQRSTRHKCPRRICPKFCKRNKYFTLPLLFIFINLSKGNEWMFIFQIPVIDHTHRYLTSRSIFFQLRRNEMNVEKNFHRTMHEAVLRWVRSLTFYFIGIHRRR